MPIYRNWKDPTEYIFTENLSNKGWAWEFLRRNRAYQADFEREFEARKEFLDDPLTVIPDDSEVLLKWGIKNFLLNPEEDAPFIQFGNLSKTRIKTSRLLSHRPDSGHALYDFDLSLPLKQQIKKAYKDLQDRQKYTKSRGGFDLTRPKLHKDKWPEYLRILDAKATGTRNNDVIALVLYPNDANDYSNNYPARNKVRKNYEAAKTLVNGGYKLIVAL